MFTSCNTIGCSHISHLPYAELNVTLFLEFLNLDSRVMHELFYLPCTKVHVWSCYQIPCFLFVEYLQFNKITC